jgi:alginate biosynthesis protein AlgX
MKKLVVLFTLLLTVSLSVSLAQTITLCPEGIATTQHDQWWPVPGFIPASDGWVFGEWDLRTDFAIPEDIVPYMQRLVAALKARGIILIGIPLPSRGMLHAQHLDKTNPLAAAYSPELATQNYLAAIKQYESLGMVMVNPLPYLTTEVDSLDFKTDMHWTPNGARQVAQAVADKLKILPEAASLPTNTFTTSEIGEGEYEGVYTKDMMRLCNIPLPKEPIQRYELSGGPEVGLLEDATPKIMLLGTSFSQDIFAFDKFLKVASGLDIANLATEGGTKWYSFERLFVNEATPLPKILLWEFPAIDIKGWEVTSIKRIIPMIYGSCKPELTLRTEDRAISATDPILIENPDTLPITGSRYFLQLDFPDVTVRDFLLNFVYKDGSSEPIRVQRDNRVENEGRYLIELSDTITGTLDRIEFQESDYQGNVKSSLCSIN